MKLPHNATKVPARVRGIPCTAAATYIHIEPGDPGADSDWDFYGYDEVEFNLYDRSGYRATWLEKSMTADDEAQIKLDLIEAWKQESSEIWSIA